MTGINKGLRKWKVFQGMSYADINGQWVPADIAQEMYDFMLEIKKFGFSNPAHEIYGYDRIDEIITRASGELNEDKG